MLPRQWHSVVFISSPKIIMVQVNLSVKKIVCKSFLGNTEMKHYFLSISIVLAVVRLVSIEGKVSR